MMCRCKECIHCKKIKGEYCCTIDGSYDALEDEEEINFCAWFEPIK